MSNWLKKEKTKAIFRDLSIALLIILFLLILLGKRMFIKVKSGEIGVLYDLVSGTEMDKIYTEGLHVISPLNTMYVYNIRVQKVEKEQEVLSFNGLRIQIKYSVLFRPDIQRLTYLHQKLGPDYANTVVAPAAESWTRKLIADLLPDEIYLMDKGVREDAGNDDSLSDLLMSKDIIMDGYMISSIKLPDSISRSIERKYAEQQLAMEYDYRIQVEEKERNRKNIEAKGLQEFRAVSNISPEMWKALDVTQKIGTAPNSKVIIMGNSSQQLPVLLNDKLFQTDK